MTQTRLLGLLYGRDSEWTQIAFGTREASYPCHATLWCLRQNGQMSSAFLTLTSWEGRRNRRILCHLELQLSQSSFMLLFKQFNLICVTTAKLLNLTVPSFHHPYNEDKWICFLWLSEIKWVKKYKLFSTMPGTLSTNKRFVFRLSAFTYVLLPLLVQQPGEAALPFYIFAYSSIKWE